ncbi:MAG: IS200/IS605 family transposase [Planctomycetota bacterium]|jgi:REP element-mobilizing transposase RayT
MSYTSLTYHMIYPTKDRRPFVSADLRPRLVKYIGGIIRELGGQMLEADGPEDHLHVVAVLGPTQSIAEAVRIIKTNSSKWVHQTFPDALFAWQDGYSAFTVSPSQLPKVTAYIRRQQQHHRKTSLRDELIALFNAHGIQYDEQYLPA